VDAALHLETEPQPRCVVCGSAGRPRYDGLTDRLFGAPGSWDLKECLAAGCGTLWLDPRPTAADIGKAYQSYYTHDAAGLQGFVKRAVRAAAREHAAARYGFAASRLPGPGKHLAAALVSLYPGLRAHLDLLVRYLPATAMGGKRLLDVGCGNGQALEILADLGWQVCGVEIDPRAVEAARSRGLDVREGTLAQAQFPEGSFDAVTSSHVIEHVHDPRALLADSRRVLAPGGALVAVTPNARGMTHRLHGRNWRGLEPPRHLALFTRESLGALAESAGLREVRVTTTPRAAALLHISSIEIARGGSESGRWPGLPVWLRGQLLQCWEPLAMRLGRAEGDELLLMASK
jgi:2-polyprenyl-3-methyl-5-hydroxy-6-metoxy-1,4-benzoquinol methylase